MYTQNFPHNIQLTVSPDPDPISPLELFDSPVRFHCFHRRYSLGNSDLTLHEARALTRDPDYYTLPLYLYDHSGITISTSPFSCPWDSGQLGIVSVHIPTARVYFGAQADLGVVLETSVREYADYLEGDVYQFTITQDGKHLESCGGFIGDEDYCISEGTMLAQAIVARLDAERAQEDADIELAYQNL